MAVPPPSDHVLLRRYRDGHADAPALLYRRYAGRLRALASRRCSPDLRARLDPEDVVQSVFCDFFRGAIEGRYEVPEGEAIWKLLLVMGLNEIRRVGQYHRAARRDIRRTAHGWDYDRAIEVASAPDELGLVTLRVAVGEILDGSPRCYRPIVQMRVEGYPVAVIAERNRFSKRTVERALREFRGKLAAHIRERPARPGGRTGGSSRASRRLPTSGRRRRAP